MLSVIVLNWNGWEDTIECLSSLLQSHFNQFRIVLIDNGSSDDSLEKIREWADGKIPVSVGPHGGKVSSWQVSLTEISGSNPSTAGGAGEFVPTENSNDLILIRNDRNLGFAAGNNVGIRFALSRGFDRILLLNNDTTVDPECLEVLSEFLDSYNDYDVVTPRINYYDPHHLVWNCGGRLTFFGTRKYYCKDKREDRISNDARNITFVTGCALMARSSVFRLHGLLSERFFLGEEDYEFSLRMKRKGIRMAAVQDAKVYHKISSSKGRIFQDNILPSAFIYYLNRFVNLRDYYGRTLWHVWRLASLVYIVPLLSLRYRIPPGKIVRFIILLFSYSGRKSSVTREDFFYASTLFPQG